MVEQNFTQIVLLEPILEYNDFEIHLMLIEQSVQIQQWRTKEKKGSEKFEERLSHQFHYQIEKSEVDLYETLKP